MNAPIVLQPYDTQWPVRFAEERAALETAERGLFKELHHIGSTSIPGMAAKPIIDILVVLDRHEHGLACVAAMQMRHRPTKASSASSPPAS